MKSSRYALIAVCIAVFVLSVLFSYQMGRARPLEKGVVWKVIWSDGTGQMGLYREKMPKKPVPGQGGQYSVDMYGILHSSCLEIKYHDGSHPHVQIIPLEQIKCLQFGSGGVTIEK